MSSFISIFDVVEKQGSLTPIKDEIFVMKINLKHEMDKGLTNKEMELARIKEIAVLSAEKILEKI